MPPTGPLLLPGTSIIGESVSGDSWSTILDDDASPLMLPPFMDELDALRLFFSPSAARALALSVSISMRISPFPFLSFRRIIFA